MVRGRSGEVRGGSGEAAGGRKKNFHFKKFKIMGLCKNLNMVLKRSEINENDFFEQLFSESGFHRVFSGATCTKISEIFS